MIFAGQERPGMDSKNQEKYASQINAGYSARLRGEPMESNPYASKKEWDAWMSGYFLPERDKAEDEPRK